MNTIVTKIKSQRSDSHNSTNEVRAAYPYFHEKRTKSAAGMPYTKKDGSPNPRFAASFMFPKLAADAMHCANYAFLWSLAVEAAKKMWPQNVDASGQWVWPAGAQYAVKDGDVPYTSKPKPGQPLPSAEEVAKRNAWRRGYWIVEAENFLDPGPRIAKIVNGQMTELPAKTINGIVQYKSGDFGFVNLHAYAYQTPENFGVNFGFDGFLFTREGEAIGASGPRSTAQMFGGMAGTAVSAAAAGPSVAPAVQMPGQTQYAPPVAPLAPPMPPAAPAAPPMPPAAPPAPPTMPAPPLAPAAPPMPGVALLPAFPVPGQTIHQR
jgi:hypothetical protein